MIAGYMGLGAWLLTLVILGVLITVTGLPDQEYSEDGGPLLIWFSKILYLLALAVTFYEMGKHFSNL